MEFRKMVTITLYTRQQKRHWCIEQSFGLCGRGRGWNDLGEWHWNMYNIIYETSRQSRFDARYWMLGVGALGWPRGMVWESRREDGSGWGTHVYLWRIHFDIWQNQYNILNLKKKKRTLEWVAISFSSAWKWKVKVKLLSRVQLLAIPWTAAYYAPPPMGFSRQEYWSGLPLPSLISPTLLLPKWLSSLCVSFSYSAYHSPNCCRIYNIKTTILHCSL